MPHAVPSIQTMTTKIKEDSEAAKFQKLGAQIQNMQLQQQQAILQ